MYISVVCLIQHSPYLLSQYDLIPCILFSIFSTTFFLQKILLCVHFFTYLRLASAENIRMGLCDIFSLHLKPKLYTRKEDSPFGGWGKTRAGYYLQLQASDFVNFRTRFSIGIASTATTDRFPSAGGGRHLFGTSVIDRLFLCRHRGRRYRRLRCRRSVFS